MIDKFESKYYYALIRYTPDSDRGEGLNVGVVVRNDKEQVVRWYRDFSPNKTFASQWSKVVMKEWEDFYQEEMAVTPADETEKLSEDYWDSIRYRCQEQYVLGKSRFILTDSRSADDVAELLFKKLVMPKNLVTRNRGNYRWAVSFFKKYHLFDNLFFKYPIQQKHEIMLGGLYFKLPFYQRNGKHRAIWTAKEIAPQGGFITDQGNRYIAQTALLRELWTEKQKEDADFILISKNDDKENPDIKAALIAKCEVMPIDSSETKTYFESACESLDKV